MKTHPFNLITRLLISSILFVFSHAVFSETQNLNEKAILVFDERQGREIPYSYRGINDSFKEELKNPLSRDGLDKLRASGSGQFSEKTLKKVLPEMSGEIWIIDLRRESHGYINGRPFSWYTPGNQSNLNLSEKEILAQESTEAKTLSQNKTQTIHQIKKKSKGNIIETKPFSIEPSQVESEQELASRLGLNYKRFAISDHRRPSDDTVDQFVSFYKALPENAWLHFHCRGGKGRTTTLMSMVDMISNAKDLSFEEIMRRQAALGGSDLIHISQSPEKQWKKKWAEQRRSFLELFYHYAKSSEFDSLSWTKWLEKHTLQHPSPSN